MLMPLRVDKIVVPVAASRELGITHRDARRSIQIAAITPEAREAAKEAGLDNNQTKLLQVAAAPSSEQVEAVRRIIEPLSDEQIIDKHVAELTAVWNRASPTARGIFLRSIGASLKAPAAHLSVVGTIS